MRIFFTGAFSRRLDGRTLALRFEGGTILDEETGSEWNALGEAMAGELEGKRLELVVSIDHFLVLVGGLPARDASLRTPKREVRMERILILIPLLATMLAVAACGESETGQSGRSSPAEPQQTKAEPAPQSALEESTRDEATRKRVPANNEPAQSEEGSTRVDDESPGLSVTTIDGERVNLGGQGDVTALYFMAGW